MSGFLSKWRRWRERSVILRDLARLQRDANEQDRFLVRDNLAQALSALQRNDLSGASALWTKSLHRYPNLTRSSRLALQVLIGLGRFDEAEGLMRQGQQKHPRDVYYERGFAEVAQARGDLTAANERWAVVRKRFPGAVHGYVLGAEVLMGLNRLEEAQYLAEVAMRQFPQEVGGFLIFSRLAVRQEDWPAAVERWGIVRDRFDNLHGYVGSARALIRLGQYEAGEAILARSRIRYPTHTEPSVELARAAQLRGDVTEAIQRWKGVAQHFPLTMLACLEAAEQLERLGKPAEAEKVLREVVDHFPLEPTPNSRLGMFLMRRQNFAAAAGVWFALRRTFADFEEAYTRGSEALIQAGRAEEAEALSVEHRARFKSP
jgi:predicted Zn-dependent protease